MATPEMITVSSTTVEAYGYDAESAELHVRFLNSPILYVYLAVPASVFEEFTLTSSKGSFVNLRLRGTFAFEKR